MVQYINKEGDRDTDWCMKEKEGRKESNSEQTIFFRKSNIYLTYMSSNLTFIQLFVDPSNGC